MSDSVEWVCPVLPGNDVDNPRNGEDINLYWTEMETQASVGTHSMWTSDHLSLSLHDWRGWTKLFAG